MADPETNTNPPAPDDMGSNPPPAGFNHPYTPYDVQQQFMRVVYDVLEKGEGQIGILESPTGTVRPRVLETTAAANRPQGKSLSLICAALTWLRNHKKGTFEASTGEVVSAFEDEPDWIIEQMLKRKREEVIRKWEEREARLERLRAKERSMEDRASKRRRFDGPGAAAHSSAAEDDDEWLLQDNETDGDQGDGPSGFSKETRALMEKLGMGPLTSQENETESIQEPIKVLRTSCQAMLPTYPMHRYTTLQEHIRSSHSLSRSFADQNFLRRSRRLSCLTRPGRCRSLSSMSRCPRGNDSASTPPCPVSGP